MALQQVLETTPVEPSSPAGRQETDPGSQLKGALDNLARVAAPTTVISALLFYFGWIYTDARSRYFGVDPSALGFSPQDYVLRSVSALFHPLAIACLIGLGLFRCHSWISRRLQAERTTGLRAARVCLGVLGCILLLVGVLGVVRRPVFDIELLLPPLGFLLGGGALAYQRYLAISAGALPPAPASRAVRFYSRLAVGVFMVLALFWVVGDSAGALGRGSAEFLASTLDRRPGVTVYSKQDLFIEGPDVMVEQLGGESYRYRYSGLRLLIKSGGKYFLLPASWTQAEGAVLELPDDDGIRLEFTP